ncbi:MAG: amidohydrolase family protein [Alphaproteobacteria bacterium]|nr:amidohydrolase family protein [Alphaproteobacteria bacterium]MBL6938424.1 amidohydrolase family protein [Alphaproteobacteria bacterium]MBL7096483.1 amidohydrolase family protein [Alphaproteobacteria bacterium]
MSLRIDAHQHFWRIGRGDYGWLTEADHPKIARDFLSADLEPLLKTANIDRTILVQAAPTEAETDFLLSLVEQTPFIAGVVGWIDFDAEDAASRIARLSAKQKLVGLRPMIQDLPDDEWMLRKELARPIDAMIRADLCFDALVRPRHLPALAEFLDRYPDLSVVIDHAAKPNIARAGVDLWAQYMRHIAQSSTAFCKLSGLATEAGPNWSADTLKRTVDILLEAFGPSRLMWGSDWPVLLEAGDYAQWLAAAETLTKHLDASARALVFGGTAATFYGLV